MNYPNLKNTLLESFLENRHLTQNDFKKIYNKVCQVYEQEIFQWKEKCEKMEKENTKMKKIMESDISNSIQSGFEKMQNMVNNGGPIPRMFSIVIDPNKANENINAGKNPERIRQESAFLENLKQHILKNSEDENKTNENIKKIFMENMENNNSFFSNNGEQNKMKDFKVFNPFDYPVSNETKKNNNVIDKMINKNNKSIDLANFFDKMMKIANDKSKNASDLFTIWKENKEIIKSVMSEDDWKVINKKINSIYYNPNLETILKKQRIESHLQIFLFQKYLFK